jgi:hypothetical protein
MIARVGGDPLPGFLVRREKTALHAHELEGTDLLEILAFAKQLSPDQSVQARTREHRGAVGIWLDACSGCPYVYEGGGLRHDRLLLLPALITVP